MKLVCLLKLTNHGKTLWEGLSINQMHWELQQLLVCGLRYNCKNPCTSHVTTYTELVIVIPVSTYTGSLRTGSRLEPSVIQGERDEPRVVWWGGSVQSPTRFACGVTTLLLACRISFWPRWESVRRLKTNQWNNAHVALFFQWMQILQIKETFYIVVTFVEFNKYSILNWKHIYHISYLHKFQRLFNGCYN